MQGSSEKKGSSLHPAPCTLSLQSYIAAHLKKPFQWGVNDCVLFAVGWAELATGKHFLPEVDWTNEFGAMRAIKKQGGLFEAFSRNFKIINPNYAHDGDLAIAHQDMSEPIAFLFSGANICGVGKQGLIFKPRMIAECAFQVQDTR
jgi:Domain of unknown function (DUF6950)